jgi:hypothetical protein
MTQEQKELLLKDICARLPYFIKVQIKNEIVLLDSICDDDGYHFNFIGDNREGVNIENIKPYLFPLSSMTEDMMEELNANGFFKYRDSITNVSRLESKNGISEEIYTYIDIESISFLTEYFHSHHIDYRGLIEKGLAIDATDKNIY